jgi:hypothetical protein
MTTPTMSWIEYLLEQTIKTASDRTKVGAEEVAGTFRELRHLRDITVRRP